MFDRDLFLKRILGNRDFWASALEAREIHPEYLFVRPAAYHVDDFADISGVAPGIPLEGRIAYMQEGEELLPATTAHRFTNIRISQGKMYSDSGHIDLRIQQPTAFGRARPEVINETVALGCNHASTGVYYHWAVEQLSRELLAQDMGLPTVTLPAVKSFWHEQQLRAATELQTRMIGDAVLNDIWIYYDRSRNPSFTERFERLRAKTCKATKPGNKLIYLRRGQKGAEKREIQNEKAFEAFLAGLGFETLDASEPNIDVLAEGLADARLTCTIEGSQAAHHFLYAPRGAGFLTLMPADRFNHILKEMCDILDMKFGFVLGKVTGAQEYVYPHDKLEKVLTSMTA